MPSTTRPVIAPPLLQERSAITTPIPLRWLPTLVALPVATLLAGSVTLLITRTTTTALVAPSAGFRTSTPESATPPTDTDVAPASKYAPLVASPDQPAYTRQRGFSQDARRILDAETLRDALEKYRPANGQYPRVLADLFPAYAPLFDGVTLIDAPGDPVTHRPYDYQPSTDGATMSRGERYTGIDDTH